MVGSPLAGTGRAYHLGAGDAFVIEADESDGSFRQYPAAIVVITNVEADHLDNWGTPEAYAAGFVELALADTVRSVVISADDAGARAIAAPIRAAGKRVVTFGESPDADVRLTAAAFPADGAGRQLTAAGDSGDLVLVGPGPLQPAQRRRRVRRGRELGLPGARLRAAARRLHGHASAGSRRWPTSPASASSTTTPTTRRRWPLP